MAGLVAETAPDEAGTGEGCDRSSELEAWWDGSLEVDSLQPLMAHVSACSSCLQELARITRDLERIDGIAPMAVPAALEKAAVALGSGVSGRRSRPSWILVPAAAGVAFVAFGLGQLILDREPTVGRSSGEIVLRSGSAARPGPSPVAPVGGTHARATLEFAWSTDESAEDARRYRIVVIDVAGGETVIEAVTDEPRYAPSTDERERLTGGTVYRWLVEPLGAGAGDPSSAASFEVEP
jgi:hypothetical protein